MKTLHWSELPRYEEKTGYDRAVWKADILIAKRITKFIESDESDAIRIGSLGVATIHEPSGIEYFEQPPIILLGVGTAVEISLARLGIKHKKGCKCKHRAAMMNRLGVDWAEQHIPQVTDWLIEAAAKRNVVIRMLARYGGAECVLRDAIRRIRNTDIA
jgi:hypothetical protein